MTRTSPACKGSLVLLGISIAGCTSMSGLGGSSSYGCKAPVGVACESVSGTYANALQNNLPSQRRAAAQVDARQARQVAAAASSATVSGTAEVAPTPVALRSAPRILRLWFKPWEDADHDLYDQGYVYVQVDTGRWQLDHVQRQIRDAFAPIKAPPRAAAGTNEATSFSAPAKGPARPGLPALRQTPADPRMNDDTSGDTDE